MLRIIYPYILFYPSSILLQLSFSQLEIVEKVMLHFAFIHII